MRSSSIALWSHAAMESRGNWLLVRFYFSDEAEASLTQGLAWSGSIPTLQTIKELKSMDCDKKRKLEAIPSEKLRTTAGNDNATEFETVTLKWSKRGGSLSESHAFNYPDFLHVTIKSSISWSVTIVIFRELFLLFYYTKRTRDSTVAPPLISNSGWKIMSVQRHWTFWIG